MTLPTIALAEFTRRQAQARRKVAQGTLPRHQAEQLLRPWAALACAIGADVPDLAAELADMADTTGARAILAESLCPRPMVLATLAAARDAALAGHSATATPDRTRHARNLQQLADHMGCPPYVPTFATPERKAA